MSVDSMSRSKIMDCRQPAFSSILGTDEKVEHVTPFLRTILI